MPQFVAHPLKPLFDSRARILILGSMPSPRSRLEGFYYAHPQNRFWPAVSAALGVALPPDIPGKRALALENGIALWDVLAGCIIEGASDASIREAVPNDLTRVLAAAPIQAVFTTGKTAARFYRLLCAQHTGLPAFELPSPSPANCAVSFERLVEAYRRILPYLDQSRPAR